MSECSYAPDQTGALFVNMLMTQKVDNMQHIEKDTQAGADEVHDDGVDDNVNTDGDGDGDW